MKEKFLYGIFKVKMKKRDPLCFVYKIPDTKGLGGMRPFDTILVTRGVPFAVEFKSKKGRVTKYQKFSLGEFKLAGGISCIFTEGNDMKEFIDKIIFIRNNQRREVL